MRSRIKIASLSLLLILSAFTAAPGRAAMLSIEGGLATSVPARNDVLSPAGVTVGDGNFWVNGTLTLASNAKLYWHDLGSESAYVNLVRLGNLTGPALVEYEDFGSGTGGVHSPWDYAGSVVQSGGVVDLRFSKRVTNGTQLLAANGDSSLSLAQISFAYLSDTNQIVARATNRVLVLLDDSGASRDRDFDDYVGVLTVMNPVPLPAAWLLFGSALLAFGAIGRRRLQP